MTRTEPEKQIDKLIQQLTLSEKVSLLSGRNKWYTVSIERLGIKPMVMTDGPHGVRTEGPGQDRILGKATAYPTGVSMASTWNRNLIQRVGVALAEETRYLGCHILLGPDVNIVRTPLAGRNFETFSEDPYLTGQIGVAYVQGLQSQKVGASVKHYVANNQEFERHRGNSLVDERTLREIYLAAFETIVKETDPWTVMCSYNRINGKYASENEFLLRKILKEEWGFRGLVVSDWGAVHDIYAPIQAGLDLEMPGPAQYFGTMLEAAVNNWQVDEALVDDAVRRLLRLLFRAGVMGDEKQPQGSGDTPQHRALARELAAESIVLLKNENNRLPFSRREINKLAVIGLNADRVVSGSGSSRVAPHHWVTPLQGLCEKLGDSTAVEYEPGYDNRVIPEAVEEACFTQADSADPGLKAEFFNNLDLSGEPVLTRTEPNLDIWWGGSSPQEGVIDGKRFSARWTGTFTAPKSGETRLYLHNTGFCKIWLDGELVLENHVGTISSAALDFEQLTAQTVLTLEEGKVYDFRAEFISGEDSRYAMVRFSYLLPLGVKGDLIERAVELAQSSDAVVIIAGLPDQFESEGHDRPDMNLPGDQDTLIRAVQEVNSNTAVVINAGAPVAMPWVEEVDAVLLAYYPGQEGGHALADILFGEVNPSGKLTVSFPKKLQDNPAYINYPGDKDVHYGERLFVGYRYYDAKGIQPLFPFGHGLSYTQFDYRDLEVPKAVYPKQSFTVSLNVENTGERAGAEIVQLYLTDKQASLIRPLKELKGFEKIFLEPGQAERISFDLEPSALSYYDPRRGTWVAETGEFEVLVGASSQDIRLRGSFELVEGD